jgi:hypothetical protein
MKEAQTVSSGNFFFVWKTERKADKLLKIIMTFDYDSFSNLF